MSATERPYCAPNVGCTLRETAAIMTARGYPMTFQAVKDTENRALRKLRDELRQFYETWRDDQLSR